MYSNGCIRVLYRVRIGVSYRAIDPGNFVATETILYFSTLRLLGVRAVLFAQKPDKNKNTRNRKLTRFARLVEFAGRLYDHVAYRPDQPQSGSGLQRTVGRAVHAVGQRLQVTRVGRLRGHRQCDDPVAC